jgi:hypothetical protein
VTAHLSGTGFDFAVTTSGSASVTVSSGQTATYTLALAPADASATFAFQCGTLPAYAACVFNPSSETVSAGTTGTELVQVTTSQSQTAEARPFTFGGWSGWPVAVALVAFPAAWRRRRFLVVLVFMRAALAVSGCSSSGGGGGGKPPSSSPTAHTTPAGTYSIPVTVSANGVQHVVTLTLVVD